MGLFFSKTECEFEMMEIYLYKAPPLGRSLNLAIEVIYTYGNGCTIRVENPPEIGFSTDRNYPLDKYTIDRAMKFMNTHGIHRDIGGKAVLKYINNGAYIQYLAPELV